MRMQSIDQNLGRIINHISMFLYKGLGFFLQRELMLFAIWWCYNDSFSSVSWHCYCRVSSWISTCLFAFFFLAGSFWSYGSDESSWVITVVGAFEFGGPGFFVYFYSEKVIFLISQESRLSIDRALVIGVIFGVMWIVADRNYFF